MKSSQKREYKHSKHTKICSGSLITRKIKIIMAMHHSAHRWTALKDFRNYTDKDIWKQAFS